MKINLLDVFVIDPSTGVYNFKAFNLYPYLIHALDIFITCEKTESYNWLMAQDNLVPKLTIQVDGTNFPIAIGSPGETSTNPITFERSSYSVKLYSGSASGSYIGAPYPSGYHEMLIESDENIDTRILGTSVENGDFIPMKVIINDPNLLAIDTFPFGGADIIGTQFDGFGGAINNSGSYKLIEGFGGVKPNNFLDDVKIIIEKSQFVDDTHNRDQGIGVQSYGIRY